MMCRSEHLVEGDANAAINIARKAVDTLRKIGMDDLGAIARPSGARGGRRQRRWSLPRNEVDEAMTLEAEANRKPQPHPNHTKQIQERSNIKPYKW